ncbi:protein FAR1-RELATED SEQUENCE 6-like [Arachis stenosperma]|uniref:protein FAR1-RELATED SEQUENCE 6-like n=1 Tax=Arachis stenosperma TaxID=217475 RepID=UPI0025AB60F1|nr:protein FAR1-RELATED SEQUENCE 6-like [Arachis stenosperma]
MEFSTSVGGSNNTLTNSTQGDKELSAGEVVIQEQEGSKGDEVSDVIVMSKDELELRHKKFYANYAKKVGFVTKVRNMNFDKIQKESKIPINQSLYCTREGYRESRVKAVTRANRITTTRCKARMYVMLDKEKECWIVSRLELRHSHSCSTKKAVHYHEYRELTIHAKCVITDNNEAGIRPNKTYLALANKDINPNFFYAIDVDDTNKFRSALWVDARCRASYEYYGDVVSLDTNYRINRHGLPFAFFVGVNHHGKSTLLGYALLGSEKILSFEWMFTQWVRCVGTAPSGIITDQRKAMAGAIKKVLPDTVHRWCIWHIMNKSQFKLGGYAKYEELNALMNHIVWNSPSSYSFEAYWAGFIKEFNLGQNRWLAGANKLEDDATNSKGVIQCIGSTDIERQFQQEYTSNMFRVLQLEFGHATELTQYRAAMFFLDGFYNVAQEFVACDEEAAILRAALWDAKSKLADYCASMCSTTFAATHNTIPTQSTCGVIVLDIQGPSRVKTKGRSKSKRLGAELDKSIKKSMQKRKRKSHLDVVDI